VGLIGRGLVHGRTGIERVCEGLQLVLQVERGWVLTLDVDGSRQKRTWIAFPTMHVLRH